MTFGKYLTFLRKQKSLSLRNVAKLLDIAPSYLCDIEKDRRLPPNIDLLEKLRIPLLLNNTEWHYFCNLAGEGSQKAPSDILKKIYELQTELRFVVWNDLRKYLEDI